MAVITSAQAGYADLASTWTGGVVPGNGDYAIVNHAVTVRQNWTVGQNHAQVAQFGGTAVGAILVNGPASGNFAQANNPYVANKAGSLTLQPGVVLTARGNVILATGNTTTAANLTLQNGTPPAPTTLIFDSSQAAAPMSTIYVLDIVMLAKVIAQGPAAIGGYQNTLITSNIATGSPARISCGTVFCNYPASDGGILTPTAWTFAHTVASGAAAAALAVTAASLNGGTADDAAGNAAVLTGLAGALGVSEDGIAPVASVAASPSSGYVGADGTITVTVTFSKPVTVAGGSPSIALNDGATVRSTPSPGGSPQCQPLALAASTPTTWTFRRTVSSGTALDSPVAVTSVSLGGATVTDEAGNAAALGAVVASLGVSGDGIAPVGTLASSGSVGAGQTITVTIGWSKPVTLSGGTPSITMSDGSVLPLASSTATAWTFTHTVAVGTAAASLSVTAVSLNGAPAIDEAGKPAALSGLTVPLGITQDGIAPTATLSATPGSGTVGSGGLVTIRATWSKAVTVSGTPSITLSDGSVLSLASSTSNVWTFLHTVSSGAAAAALSVTLASLNGGSAADAAGNAAVLTGLTGALGVSEDGTAPTVTGVTANPATAVLGVAQSCVLTVTPVTALGVIRWS